MSAIARPIVSLGRAALAMVAFIGALGILLERAGLASTALFWKKRGRRLAWANLWFQMYRVGVKSIGVVSLVTFCIGAILALQIGPILVTNGVANQLPAIIGIAIFRELGPLVGAIVLTGFAGASIAAELGTMAVGEEIKALQAHAISPIRFLVVPRVLATIIMTICLAVVSDVMGVVGGMITAQMTIDMPYAVYLQSTFRAVTMVDFLGGLIKAGVFGMLIGSLACLLGINVRGGAEGVGSATTRTVVISIVSLIMVDLLFTYMFFLFDF